VAPGDRERCSPSCRASTRRTGAATAVGMARHRRRAHPVAAAAGTAVCHLCAVDRALAAVRPHRSVRAPRRHPCAVCRVVAARWRAAMVGSVGETLRAARRRCRAGAQPGSIAATADRRRCGRKDAVVHVAAVSWRLVAGTLRLARAARPEHAPSRSSAASPAALRPLREDRREAARPCAARRIAPAGPR
jgi:hypothetical protein